MGKGNIDNLRVLSTDEARTIGALGGKASGKSRRAKKNMQELLKTLLESRLTDDEFKAEIKKAGIKDADVTNGMAMLYAMFRSTLAGSSKAFVALMDLLGKENATGKAEAVSDNKIVIEFADNRGSAVDDDDDDDDDDPYEDDGE